MKTAMLTKLAPIITYSKGEILLGSRLTECLMVANHVIIAKTQHMTLFVIKTMTYWHLLTIEGLIERNVNPSARNSNPEPQMML
jgi:hypothetical protein